MSGAVRILLVGGDPHKSRVTERWLTHAGYAVTMAGSGRDGLQSALEKRPDLILVESMLPDVDVNWVCRRVRSSPGLCGCFLVIMCAVGTSPRQRIPGDRTLADATITRPISSRALLARVAGWIRTKRAEDALRASEARNSALLGAFPDLMFVQDRDGVYLDYYAGDTTALYLPPQGFLGRPAQDILPEGVSRVLLDAFDKVFAYNEPQIREYSLPIEGRVRHFKARIVPYDADKVLSVVREITARKVAEHALEERQRTLEGTLSAAPDAIVALDTDNRVVSWNPGAERLFGYRRDEALGSTIDMLIAAGALHAEAVAYTQFVAGGNSLPPTEAMRLRHDGSPVSVIISAAPIVLDGEQVGSVAVYTDITERKQAEVVRERLAAQVRGQAQQLEQILASVPAGVLMLDAKGRVLQANPVAENDLMALAGAKVGDVLTHLGDRALTELLTSPSTKGLWHEIKADRRTFQAIARPVQRGPEPEHWVLVVNDVTREREIRAQLHQQERLAAVGQLAAGIAHDFNNIMATIILYAQLVAKSPNLPERNRERISVVNQQAWYATRLIEQILDFSRRSVLERQTLDLSPLVKEHVKLLRRTLPEHIKIALDVGHESHTVDADPTRMQQMLTNLAVNARDAMPNGGTLRIGLTRITVEEGASPLNPVMRAGEWIRLTVADTGTGIAPEVVPHVFEPFFTTKGPGEGTGLGLAQVHGIVAQHGGEIRLDSRVGEGTTFTIYMPAQLSESEVTKTEVCELSPPGHGETILVVEDNAAFRQALMDMLEQMAYRVLEAANGQEALTVLDEHDDVALVLSDLVMPEMGGQALLRAMRARHLSIPVVILSGHPLENELERLRSYGLSGWLTKPPEMAQLSFLLANALEGDRKCSGRDLC